MARYLSNTDCITDEDRMTFRLGGLRTTLQGEAIQRLVVPYHQSGWLDDDVDVDVDELAEIWTNPDYS